MTEQEKIELAEQYYDQGKYSEVLDICIELIKSDETENLCKAHTFAAKGLLMISPIMLDEEGKNIFLNQITQAYITAKSAMEQIWVRREIAEALVKWTRPALQNAVDEFVRSPSMDTIKSMGHSCQPVAYSTLFFEALWLSMPMENPYKDTEVDMQKADELYGPLAEKVPEGELIEILLNGVKAVVSATSRVLSENNEGSVDFMNVVIDSTWDRVQACRLLLLYIIPDENDKKGVHPKVLFDCLQERVKLARFVLDAKVYPEGKACSVFREQDLRNDVLKEFHEASTRLKEIYPEYEPYEAPSAIPVNYYSSNSSSGGCYVATAVYGSYDCPEVWTLRRFRDNILANTWYGRAFIRIYYTISPTLVKWFGHTAWFNKLWRGKLDKIVNSLQKQGVESTPYQDRNW